MWWVLWEACWESSGLEGPGRESSSLVWEQFKADLMVDLVVNEHWNPDLISVRVGWGEHCIPKDWMEEKQGQESLGLIDVMKGTVWRWECQPVWEQEVDIKSCDAEWLSMGGDSGSSM